MQPLASAEQSQPTVAQQDREPSEAALSWGSQVLWGPFHHQTSIKYLPNESFTTEESFIEDGLSLGARQKSMISIDFQWWFHMVSHIHFHKAGFVMLTLGVLMCLVFSSIFGVFQCSLKTLRARRFPPPCPFANKMITQIDKGLIESSGRMLLGRPMELQHL